MQRKKEKNASFSYIGCLIGIMIFRASPDHQNVANVSHCKMLCEIIKLNFIACCNAWAL